MLSVMYGLKGAGPGLCTVVPNVKNPPKVISRDFPSWKFLQILRTSVSGCLNYTFKICQTVAGTSTISQFHEFLNLVFGGFFYNMTQLCGVLLALAQFCSFGDGIRRTGRAGGQAGYARAAMLGHTLLLGKDNMVHCALLSL